MENIIKRVDKLENDFIFNQDQAKKGFIELHQRAYKTLDSVLDIFIQVNEKIDSMKDYTANQEIAAVQSKYIITAKENYKYKNLIEENEKTISSLISANEMFKKNIDDLYITNGKLYEENQENKRLAAKWQKDFNDRKCYCSESEKIIKRLEAELREIKGAQFTIESGV